MSEPNDDSGPANPGGPMARLIASMEAKGYTQSELAVRLGMPQSRINRWARGVNTGSADAALKVHEFAQHLRPRRRKAKRPAVQQAA